MQWLVELYIMEMHGTGVKTLIFFINIGVHLCLKLILVYLLNLFAPLFLSWLILCSVVVVKILRPTISI